ncbi:unnamed protein product, partial [Rotaria magnacalcarata]
KTDRVEFGYIPEIFHAFVPPIPNSVSETLDARCASDTQEPIAPLTLSSRLV